MLGERLKLLREDKELTRKEVAEFIGLEQSTYGKYENGQRQPSYQILIDLANFFDVSTDYLTGKSAIKNYVTEETISSVYDEIESLDEDVQIMFSDIASFDQEEKEQLKMFIDLIKKSKK